MDLITNASLSELRGDWPAPCLSLYQLTHRQHPEKQQDPIRFRNLLKPLRRFLQSTDRYQILGLNLHEIKLYEGNRNALAELHL